MVFTGSRVTARNCLARWLRLCSSLVNAANFSLSPLLLSYGEVEGRAGVEKTFARVLQTSVIASRNETDKRWRRIDRKEILWEDRFDYFDFSS